jgi:hypothetical protein
LKIVSILLTAFLAILLLIAAYFGLGDGVRAIRGAQGASQVLVSAAQLLYGLLALAALVAIGFGHRAAGFLLVAWVAVLALTNGLSPLVRARESIGVGVRSAVITGAWLGLVVWLRGYCRRRAMRPTGTPPEARDAGPRQVV